MYSFDPHARLICSSRNCIGIMHPLKCFVISRNTVDNFSQIIQQETVLAWGHRMRVNIHKQLLDTTGQLIWVRVMKGGNEVIHVKTR